MGYVIRNRKFYNEYFNGGDFTENITDTNGFLLGSVMNKIRACVTVDVFWQSRSSRAREFRFDPSNTILTSNSGSFVDDGFSVGDTVTLHTLSGWNPTITTPDTAVYTTTGVIAEIEAQRIVFESPANPEPIQSPPFSDDEYFNDLYIIDQSGDWLIGQTRVFQDSRSVNSNDTIETSVLTLIGNTDINALVMRYNLLDNNETAFSSLSPIDNNDQGYYDADILTIDDMTPLGSQQTWNTGRAFVRKIGDFDDQGNPVTSVVDRYYQRFEVCHDFIIIPYYLEEYREFLKEGRIPIEFKGENSFKYAVKYEFRSELNNPNSSKEIIDLQENGAVAWFNESYNQFNNQFNIDSVTYLDSSGDQQSQLVYADDSVVCIRVSSDSAIADSDNLTLYFSHLPDFAEYEFDSNGVGFEEIWNYDGLTASINDGLVSGTDEIKDVVVNRISANVVEIKGTINALNTRIDENSDYLISVDIATDLPSASSNKVNLLADCNQWDYDTCIYGLIELNNNSFHPYYDELELDTNGVIQNEGFGCFNTFVEDCIYVDYLFTKLQPVTINTATLSLIAVNEDRKSFPICSKQIPFEVNEQLSTGQFLNTDFGDTRVYTSDNIQYYFKDKIRVDWRYWIENFNVDVEFLDINEPNNNLNNNSSNYSNKGGYNLYVSLDLNLTTEEGLTSEYCIVAGAIKVCDYDEGTNVGVITTEDESGFDLEGSVLTDGKTIIKSRVVDYIFDETQDFATFRTDITNAGTKSSIKDFNTFDQSSQITWTIEGNDTVFQMCVEDIIEETCISFRLGCFSEEELCCPIGFTYNENLGICERILTETATSATTTYAVGQGSQNTAYGISGTRFFDGTGSTITQTGWTGTNPLPFGTSDALVTNSDVVDANGVLITDGNPSDLETRFLQSDPMYDPANIWNNRLNNVGIWNNAGTNPTNEWIGFTACIDIPQDRTYTIGFAGDNRIRGFINDIPLFNYNRNDNVHHFIWWTFITVDLPPGQHVIRLEGLNEGSDASFGAEIYDLSAQEIQTLTENGQAATFDLPDVTIFSTGNQIGNNFTTGENSGFTGCPTAGFVLDTCDGTGVCRMIEQTAQIPCSELPLLESIPSIAYNDDFDIEMNILNQLDDGSPLPIDECQKIDIYLDEGNGFALYSSMVGQTSDSSNYSLNSGIDMNTYILNNTIDVSAWMSDRFSDFGSSTVQLRIETTVGGASCGLATGSDESINANNVSNELCVDVPTFIMSSSNESQIGTSQNLADVGVPIYSQATFVLSTGEVIRVTSTPVGTGYTSGFVISNNAGRLSLGFRGADSGVQGENILIERLQSNGNRFGIRLGDFDGNSSANEALFNISPAASCIDEVVSVGGASGFQEEGQTNITTVSPIGGGGTSGNSGTLKWDNVTGNISFVQTHNFNLGLGQFRSDFCNVC